MNCIMDSWLWQLNTPKIIFNSLSNGWFNSNRYHLEISELKKFGICFSGDKWIIKSFSESKPLVVKVPDYADDCRVWKLGDSLSKPTKGNTHMQLKVNTNITRHPKKYYDNFPREPGVGRCLLKKEGKISCTVKITPHRNLRVLWTKVNRRIHFVCGNLSVIGGGKSKLSLIF